MRKGSLRLLLFSCSSINLLLGNEGSATCTLEMILQLAKIEGESARQYYTGNIDQAQTNTTVNKDIKIGNAVVGYVYSV